MSAGASYWGKEKAQAITVSPRCDWCGSLNAPHLRSEPGLYTHRRRKGYRRACAEHLPELEAQFVVAFHGRLDRIRAVEAVQVDPAQGQPKRAKVAPKPAQIMRDPMQETLL